MTARLIYANTNLQFFHCRGGPTFSTDVVGDDALHRPAMLTSATSSQGVFFLICSFPLPWGRYVFCSCRKVTKRARLRTAFLRISFCRRISVLLYTKGHYFPHVYSNRIWRADSLRQYLKYNYIFDYTSRLLFCFRLYCSLANEVKL